MGNQSVSNPPHNRTAIATSKRTKFCHYPQIPSLEAYITAVEQASSKLPAQKADELRSDVNRLLKQSQTQCRYQCNLNPMKCRALTQLKQDTSRVVLTVDKGVAMVIMDKVDYTNNAQVLLQDTNTYKVLKKDPTSYLKNKLITLLKDIKQEASAPTSTNNYISLVQSPQSSMGFPKYTKLAHPSGPQFPVGVP